MAGDSNSRKITIMLDEAFVEELRGWLTVNSGKIVKVEKPRKKTQAIQVRHEQDEPQSNFDDLHREITSAETRPEGHSLTADDNQQLPCPFCHNMPCILRGENLPGRLRLHGQPRLTNHSKRKGDYKTYYTILKRRGLWCDPVYLQRKEALGCYVEDVREVMPVCVVEDVRKRWPNPDGVPYCGHRRS